MAHRVPPLVRILLLCEDAAIDFETKECTLKNPWSVLELPEEASFPFRAEEFWAYAQLTDGVGQFDLQVEMRHAMADGSRRTVGWSSTVAADFPGGNQILVYGAVFHLKKVPFREPGLYEFRITASGQELPGMIAELRVLDRRVMS
jgi:hypothetical protein